MPAFIADTHTFIWHLFNDTRLSQPAKAALSFAAQNGLEVDVASISLAEIIYLEEKNRIPARTLEHALSVLRDPEHELTEVPFDSRVAEKMRLVPRDEIPDLPDRIVAATGLRYNVPVISRDGRIRSSGIRTIW